MEPDANDAAERARAAAAWIITTLGVDATAGEPAGGPPALETGLATLPAGMLALLADAPERIRGEGLLQLIATLADTWHQHMLSVRASGSERMARRNMDMLDAALVAAETLQDLAGIAASSWIHRNAVSRFLQVIGSLPSTRHLRPPLVMCEQDHDTQLTLRAVAVGVHVLVKVETADLSEASIEFIRARLSEVPRIVEAALDRRSLDPAVLAPTLDDPTHALSQGAL